jgi:lysophospholipase
MLTRHDANDRPGLGWLGRDRFPRAFENNVLTTGYRTVRLATIALYTQHPELRLGPPSASWISEMLNAIDRVTRFEHLDRIKVPTLLIGAGNDRIVAPQAIENLGNRFRAGRAIMIDGARHELLQEADRYRIPTLAADRCLHPTGPGIRRTGRSSVPVEQVQRRFMKPC